MTSLSQEIYSLFSSFLKVTAMICYLLSLIFLFSSLRLSSLMMATVFFVLVSVNLFSLVAGTVAVAIGTVSLAISKAQEATVSVATATVARLSVSVATSSVFLATNSSSVSLWGNVAVATETVSLTTCRLRRSSLF